MDTALVVEINVPGRSAGLATANAGVKMEPFPGPLARHPSQDVDVDVVQAAGGDDLRRLGKFLMIRAHLAGEVVIGRGVAHFAPNHGRVVFQIFSDVGHHLPSILVVAVLSTREIDAQTAIVTASITSHVSDIITSQL